jgi:hypothetical protein
MMILALIGIFLGPVIVFHPSKAGGNFGLIETYIDGIKAWEHRVPDEKLTAVSNSLGLFFNGCQHVEMNACETDHFDTYTGQLLETYEGDILAYEKNYIVISDEPLRLSRSLDFFTVPSFALTTEGPLNFSGSINPTAECGPIDVLQWHLIDKTLNITVKPTCGMHVYKFKPS